MPAAFALTFAPIAALLLSVALLQLGNGLQGTLVPLRAQFEAFTSLQLGVLGSAYFLGFALGCYFGPWLVRSSGHIRSFTAMVALASALFLAHPLVVDPEFWFFARALSGFAFAVLYMVIESWLNERASNTTRGVIFALYAVISFGTLGIGQLILSAANPMDYPLFLIASILVSLAAIPVALTRSAQPQQIEAVRLRFGHLYKLSPVGFVGCLAVGAANGAIWSLAPIYLGSGTDATTATVATFMAALIITGAVAQWPLGFLSDRMDRRFVIVAAALGGALAGLAMAIMAPFAAPGLWLIAAVGCFSFPLYTLCIAHVNDAVEADGFVEAASGLLMLWAAGAAIGPFIASTVMAELGRGGLFMTTSAIHASFALFVIYRLSQRAQISADQRGDYFDAVLVGQTVSSLDVHPETGDEANDEEPEPPPPTSGAAYGAAGQR